MLKLPDLRLMEEVDSDEDPLKYHRTPLLNRFYFKRLEEAVQLLDHAHYDSMLDLGYGSGILLPTLAGYCRKLTAVDIHPKANVVYKMLERERVKATLVQADVKTMPFPDNYFDAVMCVAILDHVSPASDSAKEIARVLKRGGVFILGNVVENKLTNFAFRLIGAKTHEHHVTPYPKILEALSERLECEKIIHFPKMTPLPISLYLWAKYYKR